MKTEPAIEINNLDIRHDSQWVLKDFSLQLCQGEKVTLTGPSGCGKSTVLRCIMGLVIPDGGSVSIMGTAVDSHTVWKARQSMAYVAQEPDLGTGTVGEIIERPFGYRANIHLRDNLNQLGEMMERFNLPESIKSKQMSALSGGEKQRVALITAILLERPIVLLDEASSALDKDNKQAVADYFQNAKDTTVLSVAHDTEWLGFSDRIVEMHKIDSSEGGNYE